MTFTPPAGPDNPLITFFNNTVLCFIPPPWPLRFPLPFLCLTNERSNLSDWSHTASPLHYNPLILFHHFYKTLFSFARPDWADLINIILPRSPSGVSSQLTLSSFFIVYDKDCVYCDHQLLVSSAYKLRRESSQSHKRALHNAWHVTSVMMSRQ